MGAASHVTQNERRRSQRERGVARERIGAGAYPASKQTSKLEQERERACTPCKQAREKERESGGGHVPGGFHNPSCPAEEERERERE